jgi:hypothetical protein
MPLLSAALSHRLPDAFFIQSCADLPLCNMASHSILNRNSGIAVEPMRTAARAHCFPMWRLPRALTRLEWPLTLAGMSPEEDPNGKPSGLMPERVMDEHSWKAHKWKFITAVIVAVIGGLFAIFVAYIERTPGASSTTSAASTATSSAPSPTPFTSPPTTSPAPRPTPSPTPTPEPPTGDAETGQGLPYQWRDVTLGVGTKAARVYLTPPAGPMSNFIEVGGVGFPVNAQVRVEERTRGRTFHLVVQGGRFIVNYTSPGDCKDYVISILTYEGELLADLRYDTQC